VKILWHSVAPWVGSGYGTQTGTFTPRIRDLGHDVAVSAYYGLMGAKQLWRGLTVYPAYAKQYGVDTIVPHAIHHFTDGQTMSFRDAADRGLIIVLSDVWTQQAPLLSEMNVAAWVPVDHETLPPIVGDWFDATGAIPIAMSRFGERVLTENGFKPLYVPHGIDTSIFRPGDKAEARARVGVPADAFMVAMVAANVGKDGARKAFYEQILAFAQLRKKHDDAVLALHTDVSSHWGVDVKHLLSDLPRSSYVITDQYAYRVGVPAETVADIYRAADITTNTSWGEGFGIPIIESQACGTPVVINDTTAMPELLGAGWKVAYEPLWHDSQKAWARRPLIGSIVDAYEQAYEQARDDDMRARAWAFAQEYDAEHVLTEYWKPALERLGQALEAGRVDASRPRTRTAVREADGLLWIDRPGSGDALGPADHEKELKPIIDGLLPEDGVFLDIGAHVGHWSLRLASKASRIVAVEANPDSASVLRRNLALNDIRNVEIVEMAAWDEPTRLRLFDPVGQVAGGSTQVLPASNGDGTIRADRLDTLIDIFDRLDLVKMDVEGADIHVLDGMAGLVRKFHPTLFIECHDVYGYYERADLEAALTRLGYTWRVAHSYETSWMPDGISQQPQFADYLVASPAHVHAG
jgi:FkbM family methyltransferase